MKQTMGKRLAQARRELAVREARDITRAMLAEAGGVDPSAITLYEGDKTNIREEVLAKLAAFLGVTPAYLRYGVGDTKKPAVEAGSSEDDIEIGAVALTPVQKARAREAAKAIREGRAAGAAKKTGHRAAANGPRARPRKPKGGPE